LAFFIRYIRSQLLAPFFTSSSAMRFLQSIAFALWALSPTIHAYPAGSDHAIESRDADLVPRTTWALPCGRYTFTVQAGRIGEGSFGAVYQAWFRDDDGKTFKAAVKKLHANEGGRKIFAAYQKAVRLQSSNLMNVYGTCQYRGDYYVITEWLEGKEVPKLQAAGAFRSDRSIGQLFTKMSRGLAAMHSQGLSHLDVKPSNVMATMDASSVVVVDYDMVTSERRLRQGCGALVYLSPEAYRVDHYGSYDTRKADVWALGVSVMDVVTGRLPWTDPTSSTAQYIWTLKSSRERAAALYQQYRISSELANVLSHVFAVEAERISMSQLYSMLSGVQRYLSSRAKRDGLAVREETDEDAARAFICVGSPAVNSTTVTQ
jgi:serine/threonine protein kinase